MQYWLIHSKRKWRQFELVSQYLENCWIFNWWHCSCVKWYDWEHFWNLWASTQNYCISLYNLTSNLNKNKFSFVCVHFELLVLMLFFVTCAYNIIWSLNCSSAKFSGKHLRSRKFKNGRDYVLKKSESALKLGKMWWI